MGRQADANAIKPLPLRAGVAPSYLWIDDPAPGAALVFLLRRFPDVPEAVWRERMARGDVVDGAGERVAEATVLKRGMRLWYYREIEDEAPLPFEETILHQDQHLLVADKPHFLPTTPGGRFLRESLLVRLKNRLGIDDLTPIHRLDRETAGVVIFSVRPDSRGAYQSLFQKRCIDKVYEAIAPQLPQHAFPLTYRSRLADDGQFFRTAEVAGEANAETRVEVLKLLDAGLALYRLHPHTGRKHQLRVHMAALGAPIVGDALYPVALACGADDYARPLKLLARTISFTDPLSGQPRRFDSARAL
ncbi:pseudouridine synthase [Massilia sp. PAMC28688]|uniref:pseudouridine synthase n=1 Tax=Massilia sp. PAMC28688 TaxID=2861283 RepID=UPI001C634995|nr:pseudouridine synthase [Massilia sp. PAMC28688]QYF94560.1 pseudouridine synthase [Massilia sp. PAMC28688]